jgi:phosphoribosyl 1,2-cyclic phosphate phosphodiesterase
MKFTFLGTAAAEGFPAVFCNCQYCREARKLGGPNIRTRSQALVNDDLLLDLPADTYYHFLQNSIEGDTIKYLLITHTHTDHFYPEEFLMRTDCFAHDMRANTLQVYCCQEAYDMIEKVGGFSENVSATVIEPYQTFTCGSYTVTSLPARHMIGHGAMFYIIQGDKTILYAQDTGYFYEEVFDFIKEKGFVFDMVSMDCTNVDIPIPDDGTHMGIPNINRAIARLADMGAIHENTIKYINHFSHNANPLHHVLEQRVAEYGYQVSYDGCQVEI